MHQITCTLNYRLSANRLYGLRVIRESNFQFLKNGAKKEKIVALTIQDKIKLIYSGFEYVTDR